VWEDLIGWLDGLGDDYGVDPLVYAVLYVGSAPPFFASLAWLIRRLRRREDWLVPGASTAVFFSLPSLYVLVAGRNLPWWLYAVLIGLAAFGAVGALRRARTALRRD
jgi:hypothetical protein